MIIIPYCSGAALSGSLPLESTICLLPRITASSSKRTKIKCNVAVVFSVEVVAVTVVVSATVT